MRPTRARISLHWGLFQTMCKMLTSKQPWAAHSKWIHYSTEAASSSSSAVALKFPRSSFISDHDLWTDAQTSSLRREQSSQSINSSRRLVSVSHDIPLISISSRTSVSQCGGGRGAGESSIGGADSETSCGGVDIPFPYHLS